MNRIVLIDGENLVYGLRTLFAQDGRIAPRSVLNNFDFRGLLEDMLSDNPPTQIFWFGAKLRKYTHNDEIQQKSEAAILLQSHFMNHIQQQRIQFIKVGYLRAREIDPCTECGHQQWKLAEKGVDVGLAVRMITEAAEDTELVVVSADTDLLPAFIAAKKLNARVVHIGYEHRPIASLSKHANITRTITLPLARKYSS